MLPIELIQRWAVELPPHAATAAILLAAAFTTLAVGLASNARAFVRVVPGTLFVLAASALFWPLPDPRIGPAVRQAVVGLSATALVIHAIANRRSWTESAETQDGATATARWYLVATLLVAAFLLFDNLGRYFGILVGWEATVVDGFGSAFTGHQAVLDYAAQRFQWDDGVLSGGHTSLFFGAPTYALFHVLGFSPWTLRVAAPLATLMAVVVMYRFGRRFFGPTAAGALAVMFAFNPAVLFYGRYGSSPAGTLLAVALALYAVWAFLQQDRSAWWLGPVCAAALFVATLQYSPARIVVLVLLAFAVAVPLWQWRRLWWRRAVGLVLLAAVVLGVWRYEKLVGRQHLFLSGRGEQYFALLENPYTIESLLGRKLANAPRTAGEVTLGDKIELLIQILSTTIPQYRDLLSPAIERPSGGMMPQLDPPPLPLYYPPAVVLLLLGLAYSLARLPAWPHLCLVGWIAGSTVPLLLTNRVDVHRLHLFVIPFSIWTAIGVREAARVIDLAKVPRVVQHVFAAMLVATMIYGDVYLLYPTGPGQVPTGMAGKTMAKEIASIPGPVLLGWPWDHREVSWTHLKMLERMRRDPSWSGTMLHPGIVNTTQDDTPEPPEIAVRQLQQIAERATIILAPAEKFHKVASALQHKGLRVAERGNIRFRFLRIDAGEAATGVPDEAMRPLPTIRIPPTPTPIPLRGGPGVRLGELQARDIKFEFAAPRIDRAWHGGPITMGGVTYDHGIGMHAASRMTYDVPPKATEFQAIVGINDGIKECGNAAVSFEVRDQDDRLLYDSGVVDVTMPPLPARVPLKGAKSITLILTDGRNGIDCDHANWAEASFLLPGGG